MLPGLLFGENVTVVVTALEERRARLLPTWLCKVDVDAGDALFEP